MWPAIIGAVGSVAGGLISSFSGKSAASKEAAAARETNAANALEAQKNRDWETFMSNTAHQREVEDYTRAGLNPILSATGGAGASTPSGSVARMENPMAGYASNINSANRSLSESLKSIPEAVRLSNETKVADAQAENLRTNSELNEQSTKLKWMETDKTNYDASKAFEEAVLARLRRTHDWSIENQIKQATLEKEQAQTKLFMSGVNLNSASAYNQKQQGRGHETEANVNTANEYFRKNVYPYQQGLKMGKDAGDIIEGVFDRSPAGVMNPKNWRKNK